MPTSYRQLVGALSRALGTSLSRYEVNSDGLTLFISINIPADMQSSLRQLCRYYVSSHKVVLLPKRGIVHLVKAR